MSDFIVNLERGAGKGLARSGKGLKTPLGHNRALASTVKTIQSHYQSKNKHMKTPGSMVEQRQKAVRDMYKKRKSNSVKSGLVFPVGRVLSKMRRGRLADRVSKVAGVYLTAVMEYMISEIVESAGNMVKQQKKRFVFPRHVYLAVEEDGEMKKYLGNDVILPTVGRRLHTHPFLTLKAGEKISSKDFRVVDENLKDIQGYGKKKQAKPQQQSDDEEEDYDE